MPRSTFDEEIEVRDAIDEFLSNDNNVMTTLEALQDFVEQKTGIRPAYATVSRHVRAKGFTKVWVKGVNA
jgi:hypothetical protein